MRWLDRWLESLAVAYLYKKVGRYVKEAELPPDEQKVRIDQWKSADRNDALWNEVNRLVQSAGITVIRRTKTLEDSAFHRGGIVYLETLKRNVAQKALRIRTNEAKKLRP